MACTYRDASFLMGSSDENNIFSSKYPFDCPSVQCGIILQELYVHDIEFKWKLITLYTGRDSSSKILQVCSQKGQLL